jgi:protoporphyrinogen oxidase
MHYYKYIILGAGPSGLAFAHTLKSLGENSFLVVEKESVPGGLCRSENVDGAPLDIGGGHFLDVKRKDVLDFLFKFLPESEWQRYSRISRIRIRGAEIDYPLEANLWQLPVHVQIEFLESIAKAGCVRGFPKPRSFEKWILWKLGDRISEEYMFPYNRKIWSMPLNELGTYWLHKLPNVSFRDTLLSCLEKKPSGTLPAHGYFLYPKKYGYGEVWQRMGLGLGDQLLTSFQVKTLDLSKGIINGAFKAEKIINTIPWPLWPNFSELPAPILSDISKLKHVSIDVDYYPDDCLTDAHWIYEPNETLPYHRVLCRGNFCNSSKGFWTETNSVRSTSSANWSYRNDFAYPVNTREKPAAIRRIAHWAKQNRLTCLGRWGTWEHMNSDVAIEMAIHTAKRMVKTRSK